MMRFVLENKLVLLGILVGAAGGYIYYHYAGCTTDSCAITSKPVNSMLYGSLMGGLLFSFFKKKQ